MNYSGFATLPSLLTCRWQILAKVMVMNVQNYNSSSIRVYDKYEVIQGERWDSNPRMVVPQTTALTTWLRSPFNNLNYSNNLANDQEFVFKERT